MQTIKIERMQGVLEYLFGNIIGVDGFLCGGFARYCCSSAHNPVVSEDIDIYCPNDEAFERIKARMVSHGYDVQFSSEVAETYKYATSGRMPLQLIKPKIQGAIVARGTVEEILGAFDFTIARCAIVMDVMATQTPEHPTLMAIADDDFLEDEKHKRLVIKNIHCPIAQVYRISKYLKKGYNITVKEVLKTLVDWERRPADYKARIFDVLVKENPSQFEIQELEKLLHWD